MSCYVVLGRPAVVGHVRLGVSPAPNSGNGHDRVCLAPSDVIFDLDFRCALVFRKLVLRTVYLSLP